MFDTHIHYMNLALDEARKAVILDEVPVGAVLVDHDMNPIAASHNQTIALSDPTAHAEIRVLRKAAWMAQNYRLLNTTLYVTVEPCAMCMGAIVHARVSRVVFGAYDPKWGAAGSLFDFSKDPRLNHHPEVLHGILADECRELMQSFFRSKRKSPTNPEPIQ